MTTHELSAETRKQIIESLTPSFDSMHRQTSPGAFASIIDAAISATLEQLAMETRQPVAIADISYSTEEVSSDGMLALTIDNDDDIREERSA